MEKEVVHCAEREKTTRYFYPSFSAFWPLINRAGEHTILHMLHISEQLHCWIQLELAPNFIYLSHILHPWSGFPMHLCARYHKNKISPMELWPFTSCELGSFYCPLFFPPFKEKEQEAHRNHSSAFILPCSVFVWPESQIGIICPMENSSRMRRWPRDHSEAPAGTWDGQAQRETSRIRLCGSQMHM